MTSLFAVICNAMDIISSTQQQTQNVTIVGSYFLLDLQVSVILGTD